ncbi:bis(5'-nucleosyl)-tetraphosphatase (symmetrical) YqeK [Rubrobacter aplysinae]|uniref:bis(5'-nucleosyl)-tetraphosphatase (symmetrical) YqeK n=1 Tax=Rubrobacter aplysinae TaxID=909625 RepID=UPI00064BDEED|nr:bis(5'-nucleosyl)-tetraphosphatase (symmetrical) YqeK [Rubrobacter aplysinae]
MGSHTENHTEKALPALLQRADGLARARLSDRRYTHTLGVADTAERLAKLHGLPPQKTRLAALLHDVSRESGPDELLQSAGRYGIKPDEFARESPIMLHGPVAAEEARRELGIQDPEVLGAIRIHTTGAPEIGSVALAVYVADKIEPGRDYPSVEKLRELAARDLYEAATSILRATESHNEDQGRPTHPDSRRMLAWLEAREAG